MSTDEKSLREKLDAMVAEHIWCEHLAGNSLSPEEGALQVGVFLLREKEQRDTPCVWSEEETTSHPKPYKTACQQRYIWPSKFCPGCGHPVQVLPQDAERKEK